MEKKIRPSEKFWAILILAIQIGLSFISIDWMQGMLTLNGLFGAMCIAYAFDRDEPPYWICWNWVALGCMCLFFICCSLYKFIIKPVVNSFKNFNNRIDNLKWLKK